MAGSRTINDSAAGAATGPARPAAEVPDDAVTEDIVDAVLASSRALVAVSARSIASVPGITLPQYRMLVVLHEGNTNLSKLAAALDVAPSTAMRMVDRLLTAGLVDRTIPPKNRRETQLALTAAGRRTVRTVTARRRRDLRAVIQRIPPAQRPHVATALAAFATAAEQLWHRSSAANP